MTIVTALGGRIRRARESLGWQQAELADRAGVSRSLVSKLEAGSQSRPSSVHLQRIADALGVSITDLTGPPAELPSSLEERLRQVRPDDQQWIDRVLAAVLALPPDERDAAAQMLESLVRFRQHGTGSLDGESGN